MQHEIVSAELDQVAFEADLDHVVRFFTDRGARTCRVMFGTFWGAEYYAGPKWTETEEEIRLTQLRKKVDEVEAMVIGRFGEDDVHVTIGLLEFTFCHDRDVHIRFDEPCKETDEFFTRWERMGYLPSEWLGPVRGSETTRLR